MEEERGGVGVGIFQAQIQGDFAASLSNNTSDHQFTEPKGFAGRSLAKHKHTQHGDRKKQREREEEERKEREGCVWHYGAAPKIAPWRPGLQLGCHGDRTTGAINRQSAPNLVLLERGQKEGERQRERKTERRREGERKSEGERDGMKEKNKGWQERGQKK